MNKPSAMDLSTIEHRLPFKEFFVHPISDVHIEAGTHRQKDFQAKLKELKAMGPEHRLILMGDLMDVAIVSSKGFYHGAKTVEEALDMLVESFKPLADRIDLIIPGNHEERVGRAAGIDITRQFATLIGRAHVYRPLPTVVKYGFWARKPSTATASGSAHQCNAQIFVHHGHGGGSRAGSAVNRMEDLARWKPDCDLYLMGHVHRKFANADEIYTGWPVREHKRLFVCTGTWLGHEHYAQKFGMPPSRAEGSPVIKIKRLSHTSLADVKAEV